ncbi:hypothetical protein PCE1_001880 [Barthelona sp. PCE]
MTEVNTSIPEEPMTPNVVVQQPLSYNEAEQQQIEAQQAALLKNRYGNKLKANPLARHLRKSQKRFDSADFFSNQHRTVNTVPYQPAQPAQTTIVEQPNEANGN